MKPIIVQKYGGSSVATVERLREVARLVAERHRAGNRLVVVVSAMGKTTDSLIAQAREVAPQPPRRELDMLVTAGERISMALLSMAIHELGLTAISFTGSQSGIITDESHQNARVLEVKPNRLFEELDRGRIVIVAGFQGVSRSREITTLGRGGSDTTAVALAAALGAEACEIYSDVDGVYTADPNVAPQAKLLAELGYVTMQAMAGAGAKVLNADAVEFARKAGIVIHARKTNDSSARETRVAEPAREPAGVVAVVGAQAVSLGRCDGATAAAMVPLIRNCGGRIVAMHGDEKATFIIDRTGIAGSSHVTLEKSIPGCALTDAAMVTLVGNALLARDTVPRAVAALVAAGLAPLATAANDLTSSFVVTSGRSQDAVRVLHALFLETPATVA